MANDRAALRRREHGAGGESLLEVLIAVVIIGLAVGPVLGALLEAVTSSTQHRALATLDTLLRTFATTATSDVEVTHSVPFDDCAATTYPLLSTPSPLNGPAGTAVTVFGTGFHPGVPVSSFAVTVKGQPASVLATQSQAASDDNGNMEVAFSTSGLSPATAPQTVTVGDGQGTSVSVPAGTGLTVTPTGPLVATSPDAGDTMGISKIEYRDPRPAPSRQPAPQPARRSSSRSGSGAREGLRHARPRVARPRVPPGAQDDAPRHGDRHTLRTWPSLRGRHPRP